MPRSVGSPRYCTLPLPLTATLRSVTFGKETDPEPLIATSADWHANSSAPTPPLPLIWKLHAFVLPLSFVEPEPFTAILVDSPQSSSRPSMPPDPAISMRHSAAPPRSVRCPEPALEKANLPTRGTSASKLPLPALRNETD